MHSVSTDVATTTFRRKAISEYKSAVSIHNPQEADNIDVTSYTEVRQSAHVTKASVWLVGAFKSDMSAENLRKFVVAEIRELREFSGSSEQALLHAAIMKRVKTAVAGKPV
jgi:hypothetical protein